MSNAQLGAIGIRVLLVLAPLFGATAVMAAPAETSTGNVDSIGYGFQWLIDSILTQSILDQFAAGATGIANRLKGTARVVAGSLALIALFWGVLMAFINKKPPVNALVEVAIFGGLSALMIENFVWVSDGARSYASEIMNNGTIASKAGEFMKALFLSFGAIITKVLNSVGGLSSILDIGDALIAFVAVCVAIIFGFLSLVTLIGLALQGPFALGIGIAISPLIAATIANPYTRRWFDQWLNFMIGAAFLTALIWVGLDLLMTPIVNIMNTVASGDQASLAGSAIQAAILMFFASKMMGAVPNIADALFPGRTGTSAIASSAGDLAKATGTLAATVTAMKVASIATAKAGASGVTGALNGLSTTATAMKSGMDFARNEARGNFGEKVSAGVMATGADFAIKPMSDASAALGKAGSSIQEGWAKDKTEGVKLGDRVNNAIKTAADTVGKTNVAEMASGAAKAATGAAVAAAGLAGHVASGAAGKVVEGAKDQVSKASSAAQHRQNMREDMLKAMPEPIINTRLRSERDK